MPLITVSRDPAKVSDDLIRQLGPDLQEIVAQELSVEGLPDSHLSVDDIEVRVRETGPLDLNASPLSIEILANHYVGRASDIQRRTERICKRIRTLGVVPEQLVGTKKAFVWIVLGQAGFAHI